MTIVVGFLDKIVGEKKEKKKEEMAAGRGDLSKRAR